MLGASRIAKQIKRLGEDFTVNLNTYKGVFKILDSGTANSYLTDTEMIGIVNPGYVIITTPDTVINVNDTITYDGRSFLVLRSVVHRLTGVPIVRVVVLG